VQRNFKEECTLSALAAEIKYDMSYLSKFFMSNVGISFTSYVNQVRISHARYLLLNTEMTVLEISHACGNTSLRTFNRNFLTQTGCTPNQYRKGKQAGGL
jgi:AraC-like DNA-binding protein